MTYDPATAEAVVTIADVGGKLKAEVTKIPPSLNDVAALEYLLSFFPMLSSLTLQIYHIFISLT